jgi:hypothetical protein
VSTIYVRSSQHVGGKATCPCGWTTGTTTRKAAMLAAYDHNDHVHSDDYNISINYNEE